MKFCDSHTDFLTSISSIREREEFIKELKTYGSHIISCAVFTTEQKLGIGDIKRYSKELDAYNKTFKTKLKLSIEDLGFVNNENQLADLCEIKPVSATLTWNEANQFAGGAFSSLGLTKQGKKAVEILENNNVMIDTAHLNKRSFWQFVRITRKPLYNSHSNIYSLFHHKRNLTDKQIEAIVKSDGFLGLSVYQKFISKRYIFAKDVALQFDYLIKKFGYKNFGLGTDFFGFNFDFSPINVRSHSELKNIAIELKALGYSNKIISHLMWKNYYNFLKRIKI